ncbi:MAG: insulinase family protein [Prevotella sp.]|nr:insulinase family protein [Prevotella sp.]
MKLRNFFVLVLLAVVGATFAQPGMQMPPIPVDTAVRIGQLDNGLTYYIRHNNWPENKANFYIAQRVGSIQENDDQRGLAHFLEHMAFNGSEHFPDSALLEYTRSLGVEFGSNLNAYTSIDQTVYRICDVPTKRATAIDSCILILKDWSGGLTLADKEIDKERGVIHQEWQLGEGPTQRMIQKALPKLYPNSKYGHRMPIGLMEIVDNFPPQVLRDYYKKWYRPDNQAIIVVGDVDVDRVEAYIKQLWAGVTVPADASKVVDELVPDNAQAIYVTEKDKEQQFSMVSIAMKHDPVPEEMKATMAYLVADYVKDLTTMMLNQRLAEAAQKPDCPFVAASSDDAQYILSRTKDAFQLDAFAKDGQDKAALAAIYREGLRAKQFGFTPSEFQRAKDEYMSLLEKAYENRNKIKNEQFGNQYRDHFLEKEPIPSISDKYQIMKQVAPAIGVDVVNMYAKEVISDNDSNLVILSFAQEKDGKEYLTDAVMADVIKNVRGEKLEAFVDNVKNEPLIAPDAMPKKGKIKKETENKVLGYKELELSNGARVILKKTDFKDDEIVFQAMAKGGKGLYGAADYSNLKLFDTAVNACGLGNFSNMEMVKALYGKQVSVNMGMDNYYQYLSGHCVPKDIETQMQLIYLHFTSLKEDQEAYQSTLSQVELMLKNKNLSPESAFADSVPTTLYKGNPRFLALDTMDVKNASQSRIYQMACERFANANGFFFYFVGNFDEATIRPLIEQYIASLPSQKKVESWKAVPFFAIGHVENKFTRKMMSPKAMALDLWHMPSPYTLENSILADAAGQILSMVYLKDIREDASAAYSVFAQGSLKRQGENAHVVMQAVCPMDPAKAQTALDLLAKGIADNTVKVDADKVAKVKENMLKNADADAKNNHHWVDVIDEYVWTGVDLQTQYKDIVSNLTPEKIAVFLKQLVQAGNHIEVVMTPAE